MLSPDWCCGAAWLKPYSSGKTKLWLHPQGIGIPGKIWEFWCFVRMNSSRGIWDSPGGAHGISRIFSATQAGKTGIGIPNSGISQLGKRNSGIIHERGLIQRGKSFGILGSHPSFPWEFPQIPPDNREFSHRSYSSLMKAENMSSNQVGISGIPWDSGNSDLPRAFPEGRGWEWEWWEYWE